MKQDRFLMGILGIIAVLVVVAVILFFVRGGEQGYQPEDTPEGVLYNYILALQQDDFNRAYGYLQEAERKPDLATFRQAFLSNQLDISQVIVRMGEVEQMGEEATIAIVLSHHSGEPFGSGWSETASALLIKQAGEWKLAYLPYPYWGWDWYSEK
jgi:hypothetical protein